MNSRLYSRPWAFALVATLGILGSPLAQAQSRATLTGVLLDRTKAVIVDASLSLYSRYGTLQTKSDWMGRFEFANLAPGTCRLEVKHFAFQTTTIQPIHIKREDATLPPLTVTMEEAVMGRCGELSSVSYEERDPDAPPLVGAIQPMPPKPEPNVVWPYTPFSEATIEVLKVGSDQVVASKHPDVHGKFEFAGLAPGEYTLRATYKGYYDERSVKFEITREDATKVTMPMIPQGTVTVCM